MTKSEIIESFDDTASWDKLFRISLVVVLAHYWSLNFEGGLIWSTAGTYPVLLQRTRGLCIDFHLPLCLLTSKAKHILVKRPAVSQSFVVLQNVLVPRLSQVTNFLKIVLPHIQRLKPRTHKLVCLEKALPFSSLLARLHLVENQELYAFHNTWQILFRPCLYQLQEKENYKF